MICANLLQLSFMAAASVLQVQTPLRIQQEKTKGNQLMQQSITLEFSSIQT